MDFLKINVRVYAAGSKKEIVKIFKINDKIFLRPAILLPITSTVPLSVFPGQLEIKVKKKGQKP